MNLLSDIFGDEVSDFKNLVKVNYSSFYNFIIISMNSHFLINHYSPKKKSTSTALKMTWVKSRDLFSFSKRDIKVKNNLYKCCFILGLCR